MSIGDFADPAVLAAANRPKPGKEANLVFPLRNSDRYPARIEFSVNRSDDANIKQTMERIKRLSVDAAATGDTTPGAPNTRERTTQQNFYGVDTNQRKSGTLNEGRKVVLYLPQAIQIADGINYEATDLGIIGETTRQTLSSGGQNVLQAVGRAAFNELSSTIDGLISGLSGEIGATAAARLAQRLPLGEQVRSGVQASTQLTLNPNKRSLLRAVAIRNFTFTFKMIPSTEKESKVAQDIIKFFREEAYPESIEEGNIPFAFRYPSTFNIRFKYGKNKNLATKIQPSFLTAITTNYNPNNMAFHRGGEFSEYDLTLSFTEERALNKQDVRNGY